MTIYALGPLWGCRDGPEDGKAVHCGDAAMDRRQVPRGKSVSKSSPHLSCPHLPSPAWCQWEHLFLLQRKYSYVVPMCSRRTQPLLIKHHQIGHSMACLFIVFSVRLIESRRGKDEVALVLAGFSEWFYKRKRWWHGTSWMIGASPDLWKLLEWGITHVFACLRYFH